MSLGCSNSITREMLHFKDIMDFPFANLRFQLKFLLGKVEKSKWRQSGVIRDSPHHKDFNCLQTKIDYFE